MNEPCCRSIWAMATRHDWCMEIGIEIEVETDAMTIYSSLYLSQCSRSRYYYLLLSYRLDQTIALYCADERTRARSRHWIDWLPFGAVRPAVNHMMLHCSLDARYLTFELNAFQQLNCLAKILTNAFCYETKSNEPTIDEINGIDVGVRLSLAIFNAIDEIDWKENEANAVIDHFNLIFSIIFGISVRSKWRLEMKRKQRPRFGAALETNASENWCEKTRNWAHLFWKMTQLAIKSTSQTVLMCVPISDVL